MDGAIIVIAVDQPLSKKPQLIQHLAAAKLGKIKNIIICLNKIDLVDRATLTLRKEELDTMLETFGISPYTIIPTCLNKKIGMNYLIKAIMQLFNPSIYLERTNESPLFRISRSFDINKPGINWDSVLGGVIGGSLITGKLSVGDEIEIRPGQVSKGKDGKFICQPIRTTVLSIKTDSNNLDKIIPGGLVGIGTDLDPYYCKGDILAGNIAGFVGQLPEIFHHVLIDTTLINTFGFVWNPKINDNVMLQIGTKISEAKLTSIIGNNYNFELLKPVCINNDQHIIICMNINKVLRIVAEGTVIADQ
jgi:translation initiation factor 2 subunit 3